MPDTFVAQQKQNALAARMLELGIRREDVTEKFVLGSGKGGQKVNKSSTCVYLRHETTGIEIKCQRERSRALNRFLAWRGLCDKVDELLHREQSSRRQAAERIRRQKRRRSRRQKQRMLEGKHHHSTIKSARRPVSLDE